VTTLFIDNTNAVESRLASGIDGIGFGWERFLSILPCHRNRAKGSELVISGFRSASDSRLHVSAPLGWVSNETGVTLTGMACKRGSGNG
jgi:hypothetical protein